jgi:peptidoglycan/LPS O-acetylase OafA/YrhL
MSTNVEMHQVNTERDYIPALDGLRFVAFLLVFCHHQELFARIPGLSFLYTRGWIGVDLFFALSAYLLTHLLSTEFRKTNTISIKKFYLRRILRIWPLYFSFIGLSVAIYFFYRHSFSSEILLRIAGLFTLTDNVLSATEGYNPLPFAKHLWTIAYEEQFYIFIPLVVLWLMRSRTGFGIFLLVLVFILFNGIRLWFIHEEIPHPAIWVLPVTHFESIVLGVVLGAGGMDFVARKISPAMAPVIAVIAFILICIAAPLDEIDYHLVLTYPCVGVFTSMIVYASLKNDGLNRFLATRAMVFFGKRSYGLYVFHLLGSGAANLGVGHVDGVPSALASFIYALAFTITAAIFSYEYLETPFLRWKRKFEIISSRPI